MNKPRGLEIQRIDRSIDRSAIPCQELVGWLGLVDNLSEETEEEASVLCWGFNLLL
jgi:hypothetical protein